MIVVQSVTEHLRQRLLESVGVVTSEHPDLVSLRDTEWSEEFEQLMRNRLIMGSFRYRLLGDPDKPKYNRVDSVRRRLDEYERSGNTEMLVDAANGCLLEFVEGTHPLKHFAPNDDREHFSH